MEVGLHLLRKAKAEEKKEKAEVQKALQKRRQEVLNYFKNIKNLREHEMQEIALKMQTDQGIEQLVHQLHWGKESAPQVVKKRPKTSKRKVRANIDEVPTTNQVETDQSPEEQVKQFKAENKKKINMLKKGNNALHRKGQNHE